MVKVRTDLSGMTFGKLTVLRQDEDYISPNGRHMARWLCECSCEQHNKISVLGTSLKNKDTKSCGCLVRELYNDMKGHNNYDFYEDYVVGYCSNTGTPFYVDLDDYNKIKNYTWYEHIMADGYHALESSDKDNGKTVRMHYLIIGKYCDHIDRNPLNNRKHNLRPASNSENSINRNVRHDSTSGVSGVSFKKANNKWCAYICVNNKQKYLGLFEEKNDAIKERLKAEVKYFGEFAPQKHLFNQYGIDT